MIETGMLDCHLGDTPMDPNVKLLPDQGEPLKDPKRYLHLVGKLNYIIVTIPYITFAINVVTQFFKEPCDIHWNVVICILQYLKNAPSQINI